MSLRLLLNIIIAGKMEIEITQSLTVKKSNTLILWPVMLTKVAMSLVTFIAGKIAGEWPAKAGESPTQNSRISRKIFQTLSEM